MSFLVPEKSEFLEDRQGKKGDNVDNRENVNKNADEGNNKKNILETKEIEKSKIDLEKM